MSVPMTGMRMAGVGSLGGSAFDHAANAAGYDTNGAGGKLGARLGMGLGVTRQLATRVLPSAVRGGYSALPNPVTSALNSGTQSLARNTIAASRGASNFGNGAMHGLFNPLTYPFRRAANYVTGQAKPGGFLNRRLGVEAGKLPFSNTVFNGPTSQLGRAGRALGIGTLGVGSAGFGYGMLHNKITGGVRDAVGQMYGELAPQLQQDVTDMADQYMHSRGMMDEYGQFNPLAAASRNGGLVQRLMVGSDGIFHQLGLDPSRLSPLQKLMILGGTAVGSGGLMAGSPALAGIGGMSAMGGLLPYLMPGQSQQGGMVGGMGPQNVPYRPGQPISQNPVNVPPPNTPQARNEWHQFQAQPE